MYVPAHFAADDGLVSELLTRHGAADLVTNTSQGLLATMLPFIHDPAAGEHGALLGHLREFWHLTQEMITLLRRLCGRRC